MTEIEKLLPNSKFITLTKKKNGYLTIEGNNNFKGGIDANSYFGKKDLVYFYILDGEVIKIGQTSKTMADRIADYNRKRKSDSTEGRLMKEVWNNNTTVEVHVFYADQEIEFMGMNIQMNPIMLEQAFLQRYYSLFGRLPKLNFKMG